MKRLFRYETPKWVARLLCITYCCIGILFFLAYYHYDVWAEGAVSFLKYFFAFLSVVFLIISLKPSNSRVWIYFSADDKGLYFPLGRSYQESPADLLIPWHKIGEIKSETIYYGIKGISLELLLTDEQFNRHFKQYSQVNKILGFDLKRRDFYVVAYANNIFQSVNSVVETLNQLKAKFTLSANDSSARMHN